MRTFLNILNLCKAKQFSWDCQWKKELMVKANLIG